MTRVNIPLPDELHRKVKVVCARNNITIKTMVEGVIKKEIVRKKSK